MRLADHIAQCRTPLLVANTKEGSTRHLNIEAAFAARLPGSSIHRTIAMAALFGLISACTTSPRAPVVAERADTIVEIKSTGAVTAGAPVGIATAAAPVADQTVRNSEIADQSYLKSGYRVAHRNGQLVYCRSEAITGTLFRSTVCKTNAEMKAAEQIRQNVADELGKPHGGVCNNPPKC
jgi:hypothetical protein